MRKTYSKPCIAVENFLIQDSIAAGCAAKINLGNSDSCTDTTIEGYNASLQAQILGWVNMGYFPDTTICKTKYFGADDASDGICYFTAANNVFRS